MLRWDDVVGSSVISLSLASVAIAFIFFISSCKIEEDKRWEETRATSMLLKNELVSQGWSAKEIACAVDKQKDVCLTLER